MKQSIFVLSCDESSIKIQITNVHKHIVNYICYTSMNVGDICTYKVDESTLPKIFNEDRKNYIRKINESLKLRVMIKLKDHLIDYKCDQDVEIKTLSRTTGIISKDDGKIISYITPKEDVDKIEDSSFEVRQSNNGIKVGLIPITTKSITSQDMLLEDYMNHTYIIRIKSRVSIQHAMKIIMLRCLDVVNHMSFIKHKIFETRYMIYDTRYTNIAHNFVEVALIRASVFTFIETHRISNISIITPLRVYTDEILADQIMKASIVEYNDKSIQSLKKIKSFVGPTIIYSHEIDTSLYPGVEIVRLKKDQKFEFQITELKLSTGLLDQLHCPCIITYDMSDNIIENYNDVEDYNDVENHNDLEIKCTCNKSQKHKSHPMSVTKNASHEFNPCTIDCDTCFAYEIEQLSYIEPTDILTSSIKNLQKFYESFNEEVQKACDLKL